MRTSIYRFVALVLVPTMILADPSWAAGIAQISFSRPATFCGHFDLEAVTPPLDMGYRGDHGAIVNRQKAGSELKRSYTNQTSIFGTWKRIVAVPAIVISFLPQASIRNKYNLIHLLRTKEKLPPSSF